MSETARYVLVFALAFAAGLVFRDLVWLLTPRRRRAAGTVHAGGGEVHPGDAVVFDWEDARSDEERVARQLRPRHHLTVVDERWTLHP